MIKLIIKYTILLVISLILVNIIATIMSAIFPHFLTLVVSEGRTITVDIGYLKGGVGFIFNIIFVFLISSDVKKENIRANWVLVLTFFYNLFGVIFFFLILTHKKLNSKNLNYE